MACSKEARRASRPRRVPIGACCGGVVPVGRSRSLQLWARPPRRDASARKPSLWAYYRPWRCAKDGSWRDTNYTVASPCSADVGRVRGASAARDDAPFGGAGHRQRPGPCPPGRSEVFGPGARRNVSDRASVYIV
ncbi:hypothetical protein MRX96_032233 [Rhipicephalus microplus]